MLAEVQGLARRGQALQDVYQNSNCSSSGMSRSVST